MRRNELKGKEDDELLIPRARIFFSGKSLAVVSAADNGMQWVAVSGLEAAAW